MANTDAPRGFTPVKYKSGAPYTGQVRVVECGAEDMFIGDLVSIASGLAVPADTGDAIIAGVAMGFGKKTAKGLGDQTQPFDPDNLMRMSYDVSAVTSTEWVCFYAPADDLIMEVQTDADRDFAVGDPCDVLATAATNHDIGRSAHEATASTNADLIVVELPQRPDNDPALANAKILVAVTHQELLNA